MWWLCGVLWIATGITTAKVVNIIQKETVTLKDLSICMFLGPIAAIVVLYVEAKSIIVFKAPK